MTPVIYADTLFLFNFLINTVVLIITTKFINERLRCLRIALGAALGGVYSVFMFFPHLEILYTFFFKGVILLGIFYIVFGGKSIHRLLKNFAVFILVNTALGGGLLALIFLTGFGTAVGSVVSGGEIYLNISPLILIFGISGTYMLLGIYQKISKRVLYEKSLIKRVKIEYKNKTAEVDMLIDTGCNLCDPVTDKPAVIAELKWLELLLSEEEREFVKNGTDAGKAYEMGLRVLPFSTISGENRVFGILADKVTGDNFEAEKVTVGIITGGMTGRSCGGIINPELLLDNQKNAEECGI